jgi:hypothetical protein
LQLFICWSGERSRLLAETLRAHLPRIVSGLDPFISSEIGKGTLWFDELAGRIEKSSAGLICLTPENLESPWVHYEAGALAKNFSRKPGRIFTYLFGLQPSEVTGPLAAYQSTVADREDTARLIHAMVGFMRRDERAGSAGWQEQFETWWPPLEKQINSIRTLPLDVVISDIEGLFRRKTYDEPLSECTAQSWLDRYSGARETEKTLRGHFERVQATCGEYEVEVYAELMSQVGGYAMDLRALLLREERFDLGEQGRLCISPPGIEAACEERRRGIKRILSQLVDPRQFPHFPEAFNFDRAETLEEKRHLIHRAAAQLQRDLAADESAAVDGNPWADSDWDFDRIMSYVTEARRLGPRSEAEAESLIGRVSDELERAKSREGRARLVPLDYALSSLRAVFGRQPMTAPVPAAAQSVVQDVKNYMETAGRLEGAASVTASIRELEAVIQGRISPQAASRKPRSLKTGRTT